ncbi:ABC transporter permease [Fictibacillus sp. KIGAM418]|uniref:ABC transporter permease n=1 Tax=Fictibacillus marinisediminis TaxID=2878389 RepID=A0A9X1XC26_9BACL|nr:ABC transporter permease [Fictibacillus marinisediminis]MCK6258142.1 ABC transporter permease [Fictibacillus marinisediminis]
MSKTILNKAHSDYLLNLRRRTIQVRLTQLLIFVVFFGLWQYSSDHKWIDPLLFSSPAKIAALLAEKISDGSVFVHIGMTLTETVIGFLLGTLIGTSLAALIWWFPFLSRVLDPYLVILNAMPKVAIGPILIVALGPNLSSIVAMGVLISVIITTIVIYTSFTNVEPNYVKVIRSFGGSKFQCFKEVILPACFPAIISSLKVNVGLSWVGVIVGEFLVSKEGLGYLIIYGFQVFNFTLVLMSLLIIAFLATIMYQLVEALEKKLIKNRES